MRINAACYMRKGYMMSKERMINFDDSELFDNSDFDVEALLRKIDEEEAIKKSEDDEK